MGLGTRLFTGLLFPARGACLQTLPQRLERVDYQQLSRCVPIIQDSVPSNSVNLAILYAFFLGIYSSQFLLITRCAVLCSSVCILNSYHYFLIYSSNIF